MCPFFIVREVRADTVGHYRDESAIVHIEPIGAANELIGAVSNERAIEIAAQVWLVKSIHCIYALPVTRRMALITVWVALEIACDTKPRSIPSCDPSSGKTMRRPINIIIPYGSSRAS